MRRILNSQLDSRENRHTLKMLRELWETEAKENLDADWIKEIEDSMGQTGGGDHRKS